MVCESNVKEQIANRAYFDRTWIPMGNKST